MSESIFCTQSSVMVLSIVSAMLVGNLGAAIWRRYIFYLWGGVKDQCYAVSTLLPNVNKLT